MRIVLAKLLVPGLLKRYPRFGLFCIWTFRLGLVAFLIAAVISFYGWRYGLTALPDPIAHEQPPPWPIGADELTKAQAWYWVRELGTNGALANLAQPQVWDRLARWSAVGLSGLGTLPAEWLEHVQQPIFLACLDGAMRSVPNRERMVELGFTGERQTEAASLLASWLWRAAEAEQREDGAVAFSNLLAGFQLWVRLQPNFAPPGDFSTLGSRAWRRLAVEGPAVSRSDGRSLLAGINQVQQDLLKPAAIFGRESASRWNLPEELGEAGLDSQQLGEEFYTALNNVRDEFLTLVMQTVRSFGRGGEADMPDFAGVRHFASTAGVMVRGMQRVAARPADYVRMRDAYFSQVMQRLRAGDVDGARQTAQQLVSTPAGRPGWRQFLDRPAVWESLTMYPDPGTAVNVVNAARTSLESCRLALALRLSRDRSGHWPAESGELAPTILPRVPLDPSTGAPFRYCHRGEVWGLASPGTVRSEVGRNFRGFLFLSDDPARGRRGGRAPGLQANLAVMLRYGTVRLVPDPTQPALINLMVPVGTEVSTNELAVLQGLGMLPPNLRLVMDPDTGVLPPRPPRESLRSRLSTPAAPPGDVAAPRGRNKPR